MRRRILILGLIMALGGCGGGGGSDTDNIVRPSAPTPVPLTPDPDWRPRLTGSTPIELHRIDRLRQQSGATGQGVRIGVVGTGVNDHIELSNRIDATSFGVYQGDMVNGVAYTGSGSDPVLLDESRYEDLPGMGHDTGVSSLAAGQFIGAAPAATVVAAKVFWRVRDSLGQEFDQTTAEIVTRAFEVLASRNVQVVNGSLGWGDTPETSLTLLTDRPGRLTTALRNLLANDTALVVAAGNEGAQEGFNAYAFASQGADTLYEDAGAMSKVLVAWSYDGRRQDIATWSNRPGAQADCERAGLTGSALTRCQNIIDAAQNAYIGVLSDSVQTADAATPTGYLTASGTSYAAPVVSGTIALIKQRWNWLSADQIVQILKDSADRTIYDKYFKGWQNDPALKDQAMGRFGVGLLDAEAAIAPIGTLSTSSLTTTAYTVSSFQAVLPATDSALSTALRQAQAFDAFGRNFPVDLSQRLSTATAADTLQPRLHDRQASARFNGLAFTLHRNAYQIDQVSLRFGSWQARFGQGAATPGFVDALDPLASVGEMRYQHYAMGIWSAGQRPMISLFNGVYDQPLQKGRLSQLTAAFEHGPLSWQLGLAWGAQSDGVPMLAGEGAGQFGAGTYQLFHLNGRWRMERGSAQLDLRIGPGRTRPVPGAFFAASDLMLGQLSISWLSRMEKGRRWGLKLWSPLRPVSGTLHWRVPTGVDPATGTPLFSEGRLRLDRSLLPDRLTLFYQKRW